MTHQPDTELLAELGPLAAVIADKIHTVPVRLGPGGTDDLVTALTLAVAVYAGRHVLPADALALANPPHPSETTWRIEAHFREAWQALVTGYSDRDGALDSYQQWITTDPAMTSRLVRATTTYAVEAEHTPEPS